MEAGQTVIFLSKDFGPFRPNSSGSRGAMAMPQPQSDHRPVSALFLAKSQYAHICYISRYVHTYGPEIACRQMYIYDICHICVYMSHKYILM